MVKNNTIIEINGQHYDAETGERVAGPDAKTKLHNPDGVHTTSSAIKPTQKPASPQIHSRKSQNDAKHSAHHSNAGPKPPLHQDTKRQPTSDIRSHIPEHPKTLMRAAVQKPKSVFKQRLRAQSPTDIFVGQPTILVPPKLLADTVNDKRLKHARVVSKSQLITHYNLNAPTTPVSRPGRSETPIMPTKRTFVKPLSRPQTTSELLKRAVEQATSHEQPPVRPVRRRPQQLGRHTRRIAGVGTFAIALTLLIGLVIHDNMSNIKLDLASANAGFTASIPASQPSGFTLADLSSNTGEVALHFQSNSDNSRTYTLTEKPSTWDSDTLRDMYVSEVSKQFDTVEAAGRTLYMYGHQNVTWVNGGIWYQVKSAGALSDQQLIDIATSL